MEKSTALFAMYQVYYTFSKVASVQIQFINVETFGLRLRWDSNVGHLTFGIFYVFIIIVIMYSLRL